MDFQARELTQSASKQRRELALIASQLDHFGGNRIPAIRDFVSEIELDRLVQKMAEAEVEILQSNNCGPKVVRNTARVRALQARLKSFVTRYEEVVKKSTDNSLRDPKSVKELANRLKNEVIQECTR